MTELLIHLTKIGIAVVLGIFLGWEREQSHKNAGLRTTTLVMLGATLFTIISIILREVEGNYDIGRIIAYAVVGIGFLGTGIIAKGKNRAGVTTASLLWAVVGIGILCGLGEFALAVISSLVIYFILKLKYIRIKITAINKKKRRRK
jgi:putative Mg2+ transporter-C (MgtC) family protein